MFELTTGNSDSESKIMELYSRRLIAFAQSRLADQMRRRVDAEDIVQSAYRSFFRRLQRGEFEFDEQNDVWRLLAAITLCKTKSAVRHHQRQLRDVRRERLLEDSMRPLEREPAVEDVAIFYELLESMLTGMPELYREIVLLRMEGHSISEIAIRISRSERTVLRVLARLQEVATHLVEDVR